MAASQVMRAVDIATGLVLLAAGLIIFGKLAAQTTCHDPDDWIFLGVVRGGAPAHLSTDDVFLKLLAPAPDSVFNGET